MKINTKYIEYGVIALLGATFVYGTYKLIRKYKSKASDEMVNDSTEVEEVKLPSFDGNKVVSMGSTGSEVETIQKALNNIIVDAYKVGVLSKQGKNSLTPEQESRRKTIANIPKLEIDGDLGKNTIGAIRTIMGTTSTTYNKVKQKRMDFAKAYGLGNPYGI
jgi:hypothetical protein